MNAVYGDQSTDPWLPSFYILEWLKLPEKYQQKTQLRQLAAMLCTAVCVRARMCKEDVIQDLK